VVGEGGEYMAIGHVFIIAPLGGTVQPAIIFNFRGSEVIK
jgi:hypothetical protein